MADIVIVGIEPFDGTVTPNAKYIVCNCTNTNHIFPTKKQEVISLQNEAQYLDTISSTAEHTIYLILQLMKRAIDRAQNPNKRLRGKKVVIIGNGRVGKQVANILSQFHCEIVTIDVNNTKEQLLEALKHADIVTLHTTIQIHQEAILGLQELTRLKDGAFIVNTSRPEAIDEDELAKHMDRLGGFASDFITKLMYSVKCITTNHVAGYTAEDLKATSEFCFYKLVRKLNEVKNEGN